MRPAAFVDRDGVINAELDHVSRPEAFVLLPHAVSGLRQLVQCGYVLVVVTNQAGIAKGLYSEADYEALTTYMRDVLRAQQVELAAVYHCPHHPHGVIAGYSIVCDCRKPAPGMLRKAAADLWLDLPRSVLIGDKVSDTRAGRAANLRWTVLVRSGHALPEDASLHADYCCDDLSAAAAWISQQVEYVGI